MPQVFSTEAAKGGGERTSFIRFVRGALKPTSGDVFELMPYRVTLNAGTAATARTRRARAMRAILSG